jgi:very-short-patch-repair endonuclease
MAELITRAQELRRNATDAENLLWRRLRRKRAGWKFRRQAVLGPYIVDFVCFERKLIVEVDGGQHQEQQAYDARRTAWLNGRRFKVLRFWGHDVLLHIDAVERAIFSELT